MRIVEVCGVSFVDAETPKCYVPDSKAQAWAVMIGPPGATRWVADFQSKRQALECAEDLAAAEGLRFRDMTIEG